MRSDFKTVFAGALAIFVASCIALPTKSGWVEPWKAADDVDWAMLAFRGGILVIVATILCLWADDPLPPGPEQGAK